MYRQDHLKVLKVLGEEVPGCPTFRVSEIVAAGFRRTEDADRRVRNAMRKLRSDDLVEIAERGMYKLRPAGVEFVQEAKEKGWPSPSAPKRDKTTKKATKKKATKKKATKKATKKKVIRASTKKSATKKVSRKVVRRVPKNEETEAAPVQVVELAQKAEEVVPPTQPEEAGGNGVNDQDSGSASQLSW